MSSRWLVGSCVGITLMSLAAGITGMTIAFKLGDQRLESKIDKLRCELLR